MSYLDLDTHQDIHGNSSSDDCGYFGDYNSSPGYQTNNMSSPEYNSSASEMSPASNISEIDNLTVNSGSSSRIEPHLIITEQPVEKFRFRYQSEMHGTHGQLMGRKKEKQKKTFPCVELKNYGQPAEIVCLLYQVNGGPRSVHSHRLVVKQNDQEVSDPHVLKVSPQLGFMAVFQGMGIIHTIQKNIASQLLRKKINEIEYELNDKISLRREAQLKEQADKEAKTMNLNQVCLCFKAYSVDPNGYKNLICEPVYSTSINNMKSALTGELKISRCSSDTGSVAGGDEIFLFVEKVCKNNIKVKFVELNDLGQESWFDWGNFTESDVHHQYAIALRTPQYTGSNTDRNVCVGMHLYRPGDQATSEPVMFTYIRSSKDLSRKRVRTDDSQAETFANIPLTVNNMEPSSSGTENSWPHSVVDELLGDSQCINSLELQRLCAPELVKEWTDHLDHDMSSDAHGQPKADAVASEESPVGETAQSFLAKISHALKNLNLNNIKKTRNKIKEIFEEAHNNEANFIHTAIETGKTSVFKTLIEIINQFDLNSVLNLQNENKENCLHIACINNKSTYIAKLIKSGCDVNVLNKDDFSPLQIAVDENYQLCMEEFLTALNYSNKSKKLNIDLKNSKGLTAIHLAVINDNMKITKRLIAAGASFCTVQQKSGKNLLHLAIEQKSIEMMTYLLEQNGAVLAHQKDKKGQTPLQLAQNKKGDRKIDLIIKSLIEFMDQQSSQVEFDSIKFTAKKQTEFKQIDQDKETNDIFDSVCMDGLSELFRKQESWKSLAILLEYEPFVSVWETYSENASKMMFNYYELNETNRDKLVEFFILLDKKIAIELIDEMVIRRTLN